MDDRTIEQEIQGKGDEEPFRGEDRVSVPRGLLGAACAAIARRAGGEKVLADLRRYTIGDLSGSAVTNDLRPIETAPTDGTVFLGYRERDGRLGECFRVQRDDCEMWSFCGSSAAVEEFPGFKPTHWMPPPSKPKQAGVAVDPAVTG